MSKKPTSFEIEIEELEKKIAPDAGVVIQPDQSSSSFMDRQKNGPFHVCSWFLD